LVNNRLTNYFSAYINYFLPLNEISIDATEEAEEFSGRNLFYFIGGRRLLPVSKIIHHYAEYLRRLLDGVLGEAKRSFFVTPKYNGSGGTYKDYWSSVKKGTGEDYLDSFSYRNVYTGINVKYTANINIDYILDDILSALERE
jgi:hypothetical protein